MHIAVRPHVIIGVAILGASVLVANPATLPSAQSLPINQVAASSAFAAPSPVDSFIAANILGGSALTPLVVNAPVNVLAAAQQVAASPDQLPAALAALSAEELQAVGDFAATLPGLVTTFGPYLVSLAAGGDGAVGTAVAGTLTAPTPAESLIAAVIVAGSTRTRVVIDTPVSLVAAGRRVAAHPDQLPAALGELSAEGRQAVSAVATAEAGELAAVGPYLGQLVSSAGDVVSTAVTTISKGPSTTMAAARKTGGAGSTVSGLRTVTRNAAQHTIGTVSTRLRAAIVRPGNVPAGVSSGRERVVKSGVGALRRLVQTTRLTRQPERV
jgi:hypothetical protein